MKIQNFYPGSWGSNCYLLISGTSAAIVDPSANADVLLNAVKSAGATLQYIFLTHGHFDHITSMDKLRDATGATVLIHEGDKDMPGDSHKNAFFMAFQMKSPPYGRPDVCFRDGDAFPLGDEQIRVIHTPGHSRGSSCFLCNGELLITGDTLFANNVGRCDLYGGDDEALEASLLRLRKLPQNLPIYPGHGGPTILGQALDAVME
ncbi:MAG: MBL fold metallo-hydrolase [Clostridia bacterium]|nr:MBL fold metallo-hydrolase [Clostridia bacterium]